MSKNKSKIVKWEYVTKPQDVKVLPDLITRLHSPLVPWLSSLTENCYVHLRSCVQGLNEKGKPVKTLYCTRDGRFFARVKEGWSEQIPINVTHVRPNKKIGGSKDCPQMRHFGSKFCHRCVAVAWCYPPKEALAEINDRHAKKKWEVDHLNTDHKNWTADNLQWVTPDANRRRGRIARRMRKIGLDPKLLTPTLLKGIYGLPEEYIEAFIGRYLMACDESVRPMDIWSIRSCVAIALDNISIQMNESEITY